MYHALKSVLKGRGLTTAVGDEGGFAPNLASNREALELLIEAIERGRLSRRASDIALALDVAASELTGAAPGSYRLAGEGRDDLTAGDLIDLYADWLDDYPAGVDRGRPGRGRLGGLAGADRARSATSVQLVGDDLFVTNPEILAEGIADGLANALLVKVNQIGTLTETLDAVEMAQDPRLRQRHQPSLGRDRGHHDRRSGGGHARRADQDRRAVPQRPGRQVQPAAAHRRGAGGRGVLSRRRRLPARRAMTRERRRLHPLLGVGLLLLLALLALAGVKSYRELGAARAREARIEQEIRAAEEQRARLAERIELLQNDSVAQAREVRRSLRWVGPGEVVLVVPEPESAPGEVPMPPVPAAGTQTPPAGTQTPPAKAQAPAAKTGPPSG